MTDVIFSKDNVAEFSNSIKKLFGTKKSKKAKNFVINLPIEYKDVVTKFSEDKETYGFKGSTQFKLASINSRCIYEDKFRATVIVSSKVNVPDVIMVK